MTLAEVAVVHLGPALAKAILKVWLKEQPSLQVVGEGIVGLVSAAIKDRSKVRKAERRFEEIGERVAENLVPYFEIEGVRLHENGRTAVALAISQSISKAEIDASLLVGVIRGR